MASDHDTSRSRSSTLSKIGKFFAGGQRDVSPNTQTRPSRSNSVSKNILKQTKSNTSIVSLNQDDSKRNNHLNNSGIYIGNKSQASQTSLAPSDINFSRASSMRAKPIQPRFKITTDGHEHHLKIIKRQEKLGQMVKDWIGGSNKKRSEAVSAVPNILSLNNMDEMNDQVKAVINVAKERNLPPTLFAMYMREHDGIKVKYDSLNGLEHVNMEGKETHAESFVEKYGKCQEVVGKGTFGVVRLAHKKVKDREILYAVKEFTRRQNESDKKYSKRLTNEFCISSSLKHIGIIEAYDLFRDSKGDYCEVMQYCSGGDLYSLIITAGKLEYAEADCFFKQLMRAVNYMHNMGVSHRDLKPENILLTHDGTLKITDFGNAECFKMAWEDTIQLSNGICGSSPYIAPEEYTSDEFDPRSIDIWACGVIYMAMRTGRQLWREAHKEDEFFLEYLRKRKAAKGYEPIEVLKRARCRNVIYSILDPIPDRRITGSQILNSEWVREILCCKSGECKM
ncbi:serine/threonine protein kinase [Martiniozyma asiatica (nom. inval.)]|nr:serine/threonine protein kinase [Martiniozyma asiatica]